MKKLVLITLICITVQTLRAQQDPQFTQFFLNKLNYNPAYAGSEDKICALGVYRTQWVGFGNSDKGQSPSTFLASINGPIGNKFGVGLNIFRDQLGFQSSLNPVVSASYRHTFQNEGKLALGIGVGLMQNTLAGDKLKPLVPDSKVPLQSVSGNGLDLNLGLYYTLPSLWRFDQFYAGLSTTHLNAANVKYEFGGNSLNNQLVRHYYFMTGASYLVSPSLALEPNIFVKSDIAKTSADINVMAMYNNKFRGGLTYRTEDAVSILIGFKITPDMQIGYSYDLTLSNIIKYSSGSHEILFKYCFLGPTTGPKKKEINPIYTPRFM